MVLEFDPQCGTAQVEDTLQLYIPARHKTPSYKSPNQEAADDDDDDDDLELSPRWPVYEKFSTKSNWPTMGLILPGKPLYSILFNAEGDILNEQLKIAPSIIDLNSSTAQVMTSSSQWMF